MSKQSTRQSRATARRKAQQAEARYVAALRREAVMFERVTESSAARMSKERLEQVVRHGKRRRGLTGARIGIPLAVAAAGLMRRI